MNATTYIATVIAVYAAFAYGVIYHPSIVAVIAITAIVAGVSSFIAIGIYHSIFTKSAD